MRITSLNIERFGIWERLSLPKVSRGLNVFYGPNEAGKTTLMQFIRSSLYGCSNEERARYIQMVLQHNGPNGSSFLLNNGKEEVESEQDEKKWVGGSLSVATEFGKYRLDRRYLKRSSSIYSQQTALEMRSGFIATEGLANWSGRFYPIPGKGIAESLIVSGPDGARLSDYFVQTLVSNVDEATFNNVFAIGLDELQKLGTLSETDAAQMLYRLSVGVDRVSLIQVLHQIVDERNEILDIQGKPAILESLYNRREQTMQKSSEAAFYLNEYARILTEQREVQEAVRLLQEKIDANLWKQRFYEIASAIAPNWDARKNIRAEISAFGTVMEIDEAAVSQSKSYQEAIGKSRGRLRELRNQYDALRKEKRAIKIDKIWQEMAPRIEWLNEELPHLTRIEQELAALREEKEGQESQLSQEELRLRGARNGKIVLTQNALDTLQEKKSDVKSPAVNNDRDGKSISSLSSLQWIENEFKEVEDYRVPAKAVRMAQRKYGKVNELYLQVGQRLESIGEKLDSGLSSHGQRNLTEALENVGELVNVLRRRADIGHRLNEMGQYRKELERQNAWWVSNQSLQTGPLLTVGAGVVSGALLIGFALVQKDPGIGILGLLLAISCIVFKTSVEKKNFNKLEENQRQLGQLLKQIEQIRDEVQSIDSRYPAPGQSVEVRLQKAQSDFAWFEKLLPLDTQWKETNHHHKILEERKEKAAAALKMARARWRQWLKIAGLPLELKPSQIKEMLERVDIAEDLRRKIDVLETEINFLLRERRSIEEHLERVIAATGFVSKNELDTEMMIKALVARLAEEREKRLKRDALDGRAREVRKQWRRARVGFHREKKELYDYLMIFGAKSVEDLVHLRDRFVVFSKKQTRARELDLQLEKGINNFCPESQIADLLDDPDRRTMISDQQGKLKERLSSLQTEYREKAELSGKLKEQLNVLAGKKDSIRHQFERSSLDTRIQEMTTLWQSRAVACRMMEDIRKAYEKERQPETLREASSFLKALTAGQYVKIWTPLGENVLYVDNAQGQTLDVSDLSRGIREQLFIAIRLALTVTFEKHGVLLPLVLDDVLVNFDNQRAQAAARLLNGFAKTGHQIFLFTCHEHICRIFLDLETPVHVLPSVTDKPKRFKVLLPPTLLDRCAETKSSTAVPLSTSGTTLNESSDPASIQDAAEAVSVVSTMDCHTTEKNGCEVKKFVLTEDSSDNRLGSHGSQDVTMKSSIDSNVEGLLLPIFDTELNAERLLDRAETDVLSKPVPEIPNGFEESEENKNLPLVDFDAVSPLLPDASEEEENPTVREILATSEEDRLKGNSSTLTEDFVAAELDDPRCDPFDDAGECDPDETEEELLHLSGKEFFEQSKLDREKKLEELDASVEEDDEEYEDDVEEETCDESDVEEEEVEEEEDEELDDRDEEL